MNAPLITLTAQADRWLIETDVASQRTAEWTVQVPDAPRQTERAPLNLALILDRSGSMAGDKLMHVKQAAHHLLDQLGERDRVAVVAYDDEVRLVAASAPLTESFKRQLKASIEELAPGGWTDLSGGWLRGCNEVAAHLGRQQVSRALLLTDGLANRGITDVEELAHHARELRLRGVATSTFGVGLDFNEHLLEAMAAQGGGQFYYIERPAQIPEFFRRELGELLTVVAREAFVTLAAPAGVALEVLGDLPHEKNGQQIKLSLGDLSSGERRQFYARVLTPPGAAGAGVTLQGRLAYLDTEGAPQSAEGAVAWTYAASAEVARAAVEQGVLSRASEVEVAAAATQALRLERAGKREEARSVMQQTLAANAPHMPAPAAANYQNLSDKMEQGLTEQERKAEHFDAYQKRQRRS
ncbi:MAG TPA: VWA domain-containing protein [Herpetosiphonaceae bacterium]